MTCAQMYALMERRYVRHKHSLYYAGVIASTLINLKKIDGDLVCAEDFVPRVVDPRDAARRNVMALLGMLDAKQLPTDMDAIRKRMVQGMLDQGINDADEVFDEMFSQWDSRGNA